MKPVEIVAENNIIDNEDIESDSNDSILIINSIPLPLSPPPPPQLEEQDDEDEDSDDDEDEEEDDDDDEEEEDNDEVDAFEILEQTIIKQKRVAKLKNTDLRRKVLLKRTFDLVCEIMDRENGFNDDDDDVKPVVKPARVIKAIPIPSKPENEPTTDEVVANSDALELELHDHSKMDESDEDEELDDEEESMKAATTLVKLVDLGQEQSAQVPRQTKRRSSSDEDEESYDYEYGMVHLNDQQLNYKTSIDHHPLDHESDLNIYSDSADRFHVKQQQPDQSASTRSNHPRKKLKI